MEFLKKSTNTEFYRAFYIVFQLPLVCVQQNTVDVNSELKDFSARIQMKPARQRARLLLGR